MDFEAIDCVVNYASPNNERSYVHRAGRTARAGRSGCVVSIVDKEEVTPSFFDRQQLYNHICFS